jgi:hypothetical protein
MFGELYITVMRSLADKHISLQDKNVEEEINDWKTKYPFHRCFGKDSC